MSVAWFLVNWVYGSLGLRGVDLATRACHVGGHASGEGDVALTWRHMASTWASHLSTRPAALRPWARRRLAARRGE